MIGTVFYSMTVRCNRIHTFCLQHLFTVFLWTHTLKSEYRIRIHRNPCPKIAQLLCQLQIRKCSIPLHMCKYRNISVQNQFLRHLVNIGIFTVVRILTQHIPRAGHCPASATVKCLDNMTVHMVFGAQCKRNSKFLCIRLQNTEMFFNFFLRISKHAVPVMRCQDHCRNALLFCCLKHRHRFFYCFCSVVYSVQKVTVNVDHGFPCLYFFIPYYTISTIFLQSLSRFSLF